MKRERRYPPSSEKLPVSARLLTVLTVAVIALTVLFLSGCATHRKVVTQSMLQNSGVSISTDSVLRQSLERASELVEIRTEPVKVPMSAVSLTISTDSLHSLPSGASYSERSGQASVKVSRKAATATEPEYIYVYATCDSLQLQCERYEREIHSLRSAINERERKVHALEASVQSSDEEIKASKGIGTAFKWVFICAFILAILGVLIIQIGKHK